MVVALARSLRGAGYDETRNNGTVVQVLGVLGNGAQMLRIEIDKNAPKYPGVSNMYDTISSKITLTQN